MSPYFLSALVLPLFRGLGGDDGIRTHDPLLAGQVLSQLSYTPVLGESPVLGTRSQMQNPRSRPEGVLRTPRGRERGPSASRADAQVSAPTYFPVLLPAKYLRLSGA